MKFFTHAILREPGKSFVNALSQDSNRIKPDYYKMMQEYQVYVNTLREMGVATTVCPADENFPDGNFVEDPYFICGQFIIELRPGAPSRRDEYTTLRPYLPKDLPLFAIPNEFTIDGGDILKDGKDIYIGLSKRTQQEAIDVFEKIVQKYGYRVYVLPVPDGLHLKSGMTYVTPKNYVIQKSFENVLLKLREKIPSIRYFIVPDEEKHGANVLAFNGHIMIPDRCPETKKYISDFFLEDKIHVVSTEQARLVDGALTCSSLLVRR